MKKYAKLILRGTELKTTLFLLLGLTVFALLARAQPGDNIDPNWQDALIALYVTFAAFAFFEIIKASRLYHRYRSFEGDYRGYGYVADGSNQQSDPQYDELEPNPVSKAVLRYVGGSDFVLTLSNPVEGKITHTWSGMLKMTSANMADIGYKYIKWPSGANLEHSGGFKRAVISNDKDATAIYMFSNDGQRFGREVLVKSTE